MRVRTRNLMAGLFAAALVPLALASVGVDPARSSVTATFKQLGVPVEAKFTSFSAQMDFDPANVSASKAQVEINVASFDLGDPDYNREVLKKEWFNAQQFPKATFASSAIKEIAPGKLEASGTLTVKGKSQPVKVPITLRQEGAARVFEGSLPISRLYFNIGEGEWKDTDTVADQVLVKFKMVTAQ